MEKEKLQFKSKTENITIVEKLIDEVCETYKINEDNYGNILIALTEAVNNAIHHGNKADPEKSVQVRFESLRDRLLFTIKDEGPGFDHTNIPDPTDPANIEKPNGRGIFLMKNLADEVIFSDEGREVLLTFYLQKKN